MNMKVVEFEEMRLGDFFLKLHYFTKQREDEIFFTSNLVRMQTIELLNIQIDPKHRIKDVQELWRFPWEREETSSDVIDLNSDSVKHELKNLYEIWRKD